MTATQSQPAACTSCGRPFADPFCEHVRAALAALTQPPRTVHDHFADVEAIVAERLLDEVDAIVDAPPGRRRYTSGDLRRGYCPTAAYYAVRRS